MSEVAQVIALPSQQQCAQFHRAWIGSSELGRGPISSAGEIQQSAPPASPAFFYT
jgi:hypothetical protein